MPVVRAATAARGVLLRCFRALPGSGFVVCKTQADVEPKLAQAKRLGAPVVFVEASEDAGASAALVEAAASPSRIAFSDPDSNRVRAAAYRSRTTAKMFRGEKRVRARRGGVRAPEAADGAPKRLGREDVACVFGPAKPSETPAATHRDYSDVSSGEGARERAETRLGAAGNRGSRLSMSNLESRPRAVSFPRISTRPTFDALRGMSVCSWRTT